jgi:hypothetical protein
MSELKSAEDLVAEALQRRAIKQSAQQVSLKNHELKTIKAIDRYRKAQFNKLPRFWWAGAFKEKLQLSEDLARCTNSLDEYKQHCANQSYALNNLYQWALSHDPGDGSLDQIKKMLGPINTPTFQGAKL